MDEVYTTSRKLGSGSYGTVYSAYDTAAKTYVAVKCADFQEKSGFCVGTIREILALQSLKEHRNILKMQRWFSNADYSKVYQVLDLYQIDAYKMLKLDFVQESDVFFIAKEVSRALHHMHAEGWLHRDVKPENMLIGQHDKVVLADFSLSCIYLQETCTARKTSFFTHGSSTTHICTLWTRAPELVAMGVCNVLVTERYGGEVDVFSFGVSLFTLFARSYVFGNTVVDKHESKQDLQYLYGYFSILGSSDAIREYYSKYGIDTRRFPDRRGASDRIQGHCHSFLNKEVLQFLARMMDPLPEARPCMQEVLSFWEAQAEHVTNGSRLSLYLNSVIAELQVRQKQKKGDESFAVVAGTSEAQAQGQAQAQPNNNKQEKHEKQHCKVFWSLASNLKLSFPIAVEGLRLVQVNDFMLESEYRSLLYILCTIRRSNDTFLSVHNPEALLQVLQRAKLNLSLIKLAAQTEVQGSDFLCCVLSSNVAHNAIDDDLISTLKVKQKAAHSDASQAYDEAYFAAFGTLWKSQKQLLESWQRLETGSASATSSRNSKSSSAKEKEKNKRSVWDLQDSKTGAAKECAKEC